VRETIEAKLAAEKWPKLRELLGSSGTIKALVKMEKKGGALGLDDLRELNEEMCRMTTTQLLGLPRMEPKRVDMILAGSLLLEECMDALGAKKLRPTDYSLRDGILVEMQLMSRRHQSSQIALHLPDLYEKAARLGLNASRLKRSVANAELLFDRLQPLHRLRNGWRMCFTAAMILRDCGEGISLIDHPEHAAYIVRNAHFPFIDDREREVVAELCRHHERNKVESKLLPFADDRVRQKAFLKLWAVLSVADALDSDRNARVELRRVKLSRGKVLLSYASTSPADIGSFKIDQRKQVFQAAFGRLPVASRVKSRR
jgi:exopolyphosphatase/guanosine-5'-triphosphate,3'-diphosphate pyrophosphatase